MKTKITAALLTAAIVLSFTACAKPAADTTTLAATAVQTTVRETETTAPETITEPVTENNTDSRTGAPTTAAATTATTAKTFTAAQLAEFNGKDGKNAYIAYDGVVYDVTSKLDRTWKNGEHHGLLAGTDLTKQVKACNRHLITFMEAQFGTYPVAGNYSG